MTVDPQPPPEGSSRAGGGALGRVHSKVRERGGLVRPRHGRLVAGVLAGLARRFGIRPWAARVLFVLSLLLPGPQFVAYVVLWVLVPSEP